MALTKEKADKFFAENEAGFEAMTRLFIAAADSGDLDLLSYLITCIERVINLTMAAMKQNQKPENITWQ